MIDDYEDSKFNLKSKWREVEQQLKEGCSGGSCTIGGASGGSTSTKNGKGTKVASLNGMTKHQQWQPDDKENVEPEEPMTDYVDQKDGPFTGEEKYEEYWAGKTLKYKENKKIEENEVRMDDPLHTANDLSQNYAKMIAADDRYSTLDRVTNHFDETGQDYDIMVRVGETSKSIDEWAAEIERDEGDEGTPVIPELPPTEGGGIPDDEEEKDMMPFPELGEPPL